MFRVSIKWNYNGFFTYVEYGLQCLAVVEPAVPEPEIVVAAA